MSGNAFPRWLAGLLGLVVLLRVATMGLYPLTDSTEARYAEMARKMLETGNWLTPMIDAGVPFWGKPPLSMWLSAAGQALGGVGEFGARLGPCAATLVVMGLLVCWKSGFECHFLSNKIVANNDINKTERGYSGRFLAALVFLSSPLGFIASAAVMTDMAMVAGTTLSMVAFWRAWTAQGREVGAAPGQTPSPWWPYLFFVGQAVGLMAKGPVAVVLTGVALGAWLALTCWRRGVVPTLTALWRALPWLRGTLLLAALVLPWYALAEQATPGFLRYFLIGEHWQRFTQTGWKGDLYGVAHAQPKGRIWLFALVCTLPWLLAGLWWAWRSRVREPRADAGAYGLASVSAAEITYLLAWALAPCVFFTMSGNILPAYVLPGLPAFALLVAQWVGDDRSKHRTTGALIALCALATPMAFTVLVTLEPARLAAYSDKGLLADATAAWGGASGPDSASLSVDPGVVSGVGPRVVPRVVYLFDRPDSGLFYTRGQASVAKTPEAIDRAVGDSANPSSYAVLLLPHVHVVRWQARLAQAGWVEHGRNSLNVAYTRRPVSVTPSPASTSP